MLAEIVKTTSRNTLKNTRKYNVEGEFVRIIPYNKFRANNLRSEKEKLQRGVRGKKRLTSIWRRVGIVVMLNRAGVVVRADNISDDRLAAK